MEPHDLASLAAAFGDALVGLERFAVLSGVAPSALRHRSTRDDGPAFPSPIVTASGGSQYRLSDLAAWLGRNAPGGTTNPADPGDPAEATRAEKVEEWALDQALARVAVELGGDVALRIVGATALAVTAGWSPALATDPPTLLLTQVRAAIRSAERRDVRTDHLPVGFRPDPEPIADPAVRRLLLDGMPSGRSARSGITEILVEEVARAGAVLDRAAFVDAIERLLAPAAGDPAQRARGTTELDTELMTALVDVRPGQVLCDPAVGIANLLVAAVRRTVDADGRQTIGVVGRELDERTWLVAKIRLGLRGVAHALGEPGTDACEDPTLVGPFDRVVVDPGGGARVLGRWCDRTVGLLAPDGLAIARFPPTDVLPPGRDAARRGWWNRASSSVAAIVVTARYPHSPSGTGLLVLRRDATAPVLLAQAYSPPPDRPSAEHPSPGVPTRLEWVDAVALLVREWIDHPGALLPGWVGTTFVRLLDDLSTEAMGRIDRDDLEVVLRFKEDFLGILRRPPRAVPAPPDRRPGPYGPAGLTKDLRSGDWSEPGWPPSPGPPSDRTFPDDPLREEALRAVAFLRALVDPEAPFDDDLHLALGPKDRLRYSTGVTEEMRRALKRLEQRLRGEERRGRPRRSGPA